jgi:autotransporter-associated beta strand protein
MSPRDAGQDARKRFRNEPDKETDMNMNTARPRNPRRAAAPLLAMLALAARAGAEIGWLPNAGGTYAYFDPANWHNGVVSGLFGTNITAKSTQNITFASDFDVTAGTFNFDHPGEVTFVFRGDGTGDVAATLRDDIEISPATTKGSITFGSTTKGERLNFDLGRNRRTITTTFSSLYLRNTITNGALTISGNGWLRLNGDDAAAAGVDVEIGQGATFNLISSGTGATRAANVTLRSGSLRVSGNSNADSVDVIAGDLIVEPHPKGGISMLTMDANSSRNAKLTAARLVRRNGAILNIMDANIGGTPGPDMGNFVLDTAPTLVGGGGPADSTTISILPWGIAGMASDSTYDDTLLTYDAANGFRPLSYATEFLPSSNVVLGTVTAHNVLVPHTHTWDITADTTINSLVTGGGQASTATLVTGTGTLSIVSGMVLIGYSRNSTSTVSVPLDFGSQQGKFMYASGKGSKVSSAISGSAGLVMFQNQTSGGGADCQFMGNPTYTGDTYVLGGAEVGSVFLPHGARSGNVHVLGTLRLYQGGYNGTINGLYGSGTVSYSNSGSSSFNVGDNDANGDFTGTLDFNTKITLAKIGTGTQRLAGNSTQTLTTTVKGGTLIADGSFICPFTVNTNAILRGMGMIDKSGTAIAVKAGGTLAPGGADGIGTLTVSQGNVVFESGARLDVVAGRKGHGALCVAGAVVGDVTVPLAVGGEGAGRWKVMEAASIEPLFVPTTPGVFVGKENGGTELWVRRPPGGAVVIVR